MMRDSKKYVIYGVLCALVCGALSVVTVQAYTAPEWQEGGKLDITVYQYVIHVPDIDLVVPTVVSLPIPPQTNRSTLVLSDKGDRAHSIYRVEETGDRASVKVLGNGTNPMALTDGRYDTTSDFPEEGFTEGGENTVSLVFLFSEEVETSELRITPAQNAILPETVMIEAQEAGAQDGEVAVVVSKKQLDSSFVQFPEIKTSKILVTFTLNQPLRLSEMEFVQNVEMQRREMIRYLAQPGEKYSVYFGSDRIWPQDLETMSALNAEDLNVLELPTYDVVQNPSFVRADTDDDTIPDILDNCPNVENSDQKDIDRNGKGDACDDFDRDGLMTSADNCPDLPNRDQRDTDGDGVGDVCDDTENRLTERNPWLPWLSMGIAGIVLLVLFAMSVVPKRVHEPVPEEKKGEGEGTPVQ